MKNKKPGSLRSQLLSRLTWPLVVIVILNATVSYYVTLHYANLAYDRWLQDSAKSLVQEVKAQQDKLTFELPPIAVEVFRWDDMDKTFFKVESEIEGFMAGDQGLPSPAIATLRIDEPFFSDGVIQGNKVRIVSVLTKPPTSSEDVLISVAETLNKRRSMMHEILLAILLPQILWLFFTGLHVWSGITRGLQPLDHLAQSIAQRSAKELKPIPDADVPREVRSLITTINALLERLGITLNAQRRFIENAAHQLRTPLAGLKIQADRALCADDLETMKPALAHIKSAADRVAHLSTQLLVLARSESVSQSPTEFKIIDLACLARECSMDFVPKALDRDMELGFDGPANPQLVTGDETLLRELLSNLLDNAVRYGKPGGKVNVKIEAGSRIVLIVEDDGPGIQPNEADKIFERFYRTPGSPGDGCGLGLAIVKEIAEFHEALVSIGSGPLSLGTRIEIAFERNIRGG